MSGLKIASFSPIVLALIGLLAPPLPLGDCCRARPATPPTVCCCCAKASSASAEARCCCQDKAEDGRGGFKRPSCSCSFRTEEAYCFLRKLRVELPIMATHRTELISLAVGKPPVEVGFAELDYSTPSKQILYCRWLD